MPPTRARSTYLANAVLGAPPERLVTMLYDAAVNNIVVAQEALARKDFYELNERLLRAQNIILELQGTLKPELWAGGPALEALYSYVYRLLVRGNTRKDETALAEARKLLVPLQTAWHRAAEQVLGERAGAREDPVRASA